MSAGATYIERLARRAADAPFALCAGIDPSPEALALLDSTPQVQLPGHTGRTTRAGAIERLAGLVIESVRDHAAVVKPQIAWFEAAGAPGIRALERTVAFARTAGLLVLLDAKRGDVPHSAAAYAESWLGDDASSGIGCDALTVNASVGIDSLDAMATIAAERQCALYALLHTSNPGASTLQAAPLADGTPWWHLLAQGLAEADLRAGGGIVGAVVGATRPETIDEARHLLPDAAFLLPGIGAQGGTVESLGSLAAAGEPTSLVAVSRSLLPVSRSSIAEFRFAVGEAAADVAATLARVSPRAKVG